MSIPQAPADVEMVNIIDKLALYVTRNGTEFEQKTRIRQEFNPKFAFLDPTNEFHQYYNHTLMEHKRNLLGMPLQPHNQMQLNHQQNVWANNGNPVQTQNIANYTSQIDDKMSKFREQIRDSERNLMSQHQVLLQQQKSEIEEAISQAQAEHIIRCAQENEISLLEFDQILQPIIDSCTKDSISNGKIWILQHTSHSAKSQIISQYILKKAMSTGSGFTQKLHLIYLINDLLHYCVRKDGGNLKNSLESVAIPMFCNATMSASDEQQKEKLNKLLMLWSSKANFFDSCAISKLKSPPSSLQEYQNTLLSQYATVITPISQASKAKFDNYQQQHQAFVKHATNQLTLLEAEKLKSEQQQSLQSQPPPLIQEISQNPHLLNNVNMMQPQNRNDMKMFGNQMFMGQQPNFANHPQIMHQHQHQQQQQDNNNQFQLFNLPPPNFPIHDFSRPPPGFNLSAENSPPHVEAAEEPEPQPFFTLPAGLMVPQICLEDYNYRSLDPDLVKQPAPVPPSEKLLKAVEAFYSAPSHERPRDAEGWEKLGLYEYFKMKNAARKQKEEAIAKGDRPKSKSPSPIPVHFTKVVKKQKKRAYHSKSPENRASRSKSRSVSPPEVRPAPTSRSRSRKRTPSPSYNRHFNRDSRIDRRKRSVTPPSFFGATPKPATEFLDEGNKGHQMMKRLGWTGGGLGTANNQGIIEPISGGEVRERNEIYKGVGMVADPYESFRQNRSKNFIVRMKSRGEDKN